MLLEDDAYVLFVRPQGETSLLISVFTKHQGLHHLKYQGGASKASSCAPFQLRFLVWQTGKVGGWIKSCDLHGYRPTLRGLSSWAGMYLNQLLYLALVEKQPQEELFNVYDRLLLVLANDQNSSTHIQSLLRRFEWQLLSEMGWGFPLTGVDDLPLMDNLYYQWVNDSWQQADQGILGRELKQVANSDGDQMVGASVRQLLHWRLLQLLPQANLLRQWWEELK